MVVRHKKKFQKRENIIKLAPNPPPVSERAARDGRQRGTGTLSSVERGHKRQHTKAKAIL